MDLLRSSKSLLSEMISGKLDLSKCFIISIISQSQLYYPEHSPFELVS